ncbi:MAG: PKD domain-containing protein [Bacteroidales bacterium]|nr:PKD domain-containing protein [Bacteroidales bacterium]
MKNFYKKLLIIAFLLCGYFSAFSQLPDTISLYIEEYGEYSHCSPFTVSFMNTSTLNDTSGPVSYQWELNGYLFSEAESSTEDTILSPGHYVIELYVYDVGVQYLNVAYEEFDVYGSSGTFFTTIGDTVCPGEQIQFYTLDEYAWLEWDFGGGETGNNNWENFAWYIAGSYPVTLYIGFPGEICPPDTITKYIVVTETAIPYPVIIVDGGNHICPNDDVVFFPNNPSPASTFHWSFGDGTYANGTEAVHHYPNTGNYEVILTETNMCNGVNSDTITIYVDDNFPADAGFNMTPNPACPNNPVYFNAYGSGSFYWDFGDGNFSTSKNPVHSFNNGIYSIKLTVTNGCGNSDETIQGIDIYPTGDLPPHPEFSFADDDWDEEVITICPGKEIFFQNHTYVDPNYGPVFFSWYIDATHIADNQNASYYFDTPGEYIIELEATNNCGGTDFTTKTVFVDPTLMPEADLGVFPFNALICPGDSIFFYDNIAEFDGENFYYIDYEDDGTIDDSATVPYDYINYQIFSHIYDAVGEYPFSFYVENSCGNVDTLQDTITVNSDINNPGIYYVNNSSKADGGCHPYGDLWTYEYAQDTIYYILFTDSSHYELGIRREFLDPIPQLISAGTFIDNGIDNITFMDDGIGCNTVGDYYYSYTNTDSTEVYFGANTDLCVDRFNLLDYITFSKQGQTKETTYIHHEFLGNDSIAFIKFDYEGIDSAYIMGFAEFPGDPDPEIVSRGHYMWDEYDFLIDFHDTVYCDALNSCSYTTVGDTISLMQISPAPGVDPCTRREYLISLIDFFPVENEQEEDDDEISYGGCPGDIVQYSVLGGNSYVWYFSDGTTSPLQNPTNIYYDTAAVYYDSVIITNGCNRKDTLYTIVTIDNDNFPDAWFKIYFTDDEPNVGDTIYFSYENDYINPSYNFSWNFGDGTAVVTGSDQFHVFNTEGEYNVSLIVTNGCGSTTEYQQINIKGEVAGGCNAEFSYYVDTLFNAYFNHLDTGTVTHWNWDFDDGTYSNEQNPVHHYDYPGYYWVCLSVHDSIGGCVHTFCQDVAVTDDTTSLCRADFEYFADTTTVSFINMSVGNITEYMWDFDDGNFSELENPEHTYDDYNYYHVNLTVFDSLSGCMDSYTQIVVLTNDTLTTCYADFDYYANGLEISFTETADGDYTHFYWEFGDGATSYAPNPVHYYQYPDYYEVCLTVYDSISGCMDTYCDVILVTDNTTDLCKADFEYYISGNTVTFNDLSLGSISDYFWDFGDGTYAYDADTSHIYEEPGYYEVCLTVYDSISGCLDDFCKVIMLTGGTNVCNANFEYFIDNYSVAFSNLSQGTFSDYFWDFGDGYYDFSEDTTHTYEEPGYYEVCLIVFDSISGCMDEFCKILLILPDTNDIVCNADFSYYANNLTVAFSCESEGSYTDYFWDFGDGNYSYEDNPIYTYDYPDFYYVCLFVYDDSTDCFDEYCDIVVVVDTAGNACNAGYNFYINNTTVSFSNISQGNITDYFWDFGDGNYSYDTNAVHTYDYPDFYEVCLSVYDYESGCMDEYCDVILVIDTNVTMCNAQYTYYANNLEVSFENESEGTFTHYFWDFGDGNYSYEENPTNFYEYPDFYFVCLSVYDEESGCIDEYCDIVLVYDSNQYMCNAKFEFFFEGNQVFFTNKSIGSITDYFWDFGDGHYSYDTNAVNTYLHPDFYEVCLLIYDYESGCMDEYCDVIVVIDTNITMCKADYSFYTSGTEVFYTNESRGDYTFVFWDFGDGNYSFEDSIPSHDYLIPGYYETCLTIFDEESGCMDEECKVVVVVDTNNNTCNARFSAYSEDLTAYFTSEAIGAYEEYFWDFDDGYNSNQINPEHIYEQPGYYNVGFTVIDTTPGSECFDTRYKVIFIEGETKADVCNAAFTYFPEDEGLTVSFKDESYGEPTKWYWDFGNNTPAGTKQDTVYTYSEAGYYTVCLSIENATGSHDSYCKVIAVGDVSNSFTAYFTYFADSITSTAHFNNMSRGNIVSNTWDFGDGYGSEMEYPSHTYADTGYYAVCLTTESSTGDYKTYCHDVRIGNAIESPCLFSCVWPGDANNSLEANHYDIMTIGLNYGMTGPKRDSVSDFWTGHYAQNWSTYQIDGTNNKYGDCNGDGVINLDDTLAIHQNFAYSHYETPDFKQDPIYIVGFEWDNTKATSSSGKVILSRPSKKLEGEDIYGIGYEIELTNADGIFFDQTTVDFEASAFGVDGDDLLTYYALDPDETIVYIGMSRIDHQNISGAGGVATIYFVHEDEYDVSNIGFKITSLGGMEASGIFVEIGGTLIINIGDEISICEGDSVNLTPGDIYETYLWSDGSTENTLTVYESHTYYVTVTDESGMSGSDTVVIIVNPLPVVDLGNDTIVETGATVVLDAGTGFTSYLWSDESTNQTLEVTETGDYSVIVTDENTCSGTDTIHVQIGVGISEINKKLNVNFYPNPNEGKFKIVVNGNSEDDILIELINLQGQIIYTENIKNVYKYSGDIDVSDIDKGIYYLKVVKGKYESIHKMFIY